jgi:ribosomal protein S18 acetylase RimI-like enzyme
VLAGEIRRGTERQRCRLLIAERDAQRVGFLFAEVEPAGGPGETQTSGWIHELYVVPAARRRGVGQALVAEADAFFAARRVQRVSVRVESGNAEALRYWRQRGYGERARILERFP